jgi:hypothetical protein
MNLSTKSAQRPKAHFEMGFMGVFPEQCGLEIEQSKRQAVITNVDRVFGRGEFDFHLVDKIDDRQIFCCHKMINAGPICTPSAGYSAAKAKSARHVMGTLLTPVCVARLG